MTPEQQREPLIRSVTDTAMWTAAYRADESERPDAIVCDPFARALAGERGALIAANAKPSAVRHGVVLRTAMLDKLIGMLTREEGFDTVLNLAAGLDTRPYRLDVPADLHWIEVDVPEIVEYKRDIMGGVVPVCRLESIALDLAETPGRQELFARVSADGKRVLVVTEGLLGYLEPAEVGRLASDLRRQHNFEAWLTDISSGSSSRRARHGGDELKAAGQAQVRFAPRESSAFFAPFGWREAAYYSLFEESPSLGRDFAISRVLRGVLRVMPTSARRSFSRAIGIARLEPSAGPR